MEFIKTDQGVLTLLAVSLAATVAAVAFSLCNAVHNLTVTGF